MHAQPITPSVASLGSKAHEAICRHWDLTMRRLLRGPETMIEPRFVRITTGEPHPFGNFASVSTPHDPDAVDAAIESIPTHVPAALILPVGRTTPEIQSLVSRRGFVLAEEMPTMAIDAAELANHPVDDAYVFRTVDAAESHAWSAAFAAGYELPPLISTHLAPRNDADDSARSRLLYFGLEHEGRLVCTSLIHLADGVAGIYAISTDPAHRRRGLGAWITAESLRVAHRMGYQVGILQASLAGAPVYKRLGFHQFGTMPLFVRIPG
jgi:GNAT superfamily N-acetyltransferase